MTGDTTKPRDEEPVGSGPVAAAKQQEEVCHVVQPNPVRMVDGGGAVAASGMGACPNRYWRIFNNATGT